MPEVLQAAYFSGPVSLTPSGLLLEPPLIGDARLHAHAVQRQWLRPHHGPVRRHVPGAGPHPARPARASSTSAGHGRTSRRRCTGRSGSGAARSPAEVTGAGVADAGRGRHPALGAAPRRRPPDVHRLTAPRASPRPSTSAWCSPTWGARRRDAPRRGRRVERRTGIGDRAASVVVLDLDGEAACHEVLVEQRLLGRRRPRRTPARATARRGRTASAVRCSARNTRPVAARAVDLGHERVGSPMSASATPPRSMREIEEHDLVEVARAGPRRRSSRGAR